MENKKLRIHMFSSADKVDGQGVGSAYEEQVALVRDYDGEYFEVACNDWIHPCDIQHFHTIDAAFLIRMLDRKAVNIAYCHFLPDTVINGSLRVPKSMQSFVSSYIIQFYKQADWLIVVNPSFIPQLTAYGLDPEKIRYIPNYVSHDKFHSLGEADRKSLRASLSIPEDAFVVLGAGQVQTRKGVQDFVKVAESMPDIYFVWAGGFSFGQITDGYDELKKIMENPPENVRFPGIVPRSQMVSYYNMTDVLFIPSYNELFPMTILEAANLNVPMVIRDLDLYKDILFGHYLKGNSNEEFISLIDSLHKDPKLLKKYQQESAAISDYYSAENVARIWKDFYLEAYQKKHPNTGPIYEEK